MVSIRKLKSGNYQVQIRASGLSPVTKSFARKKDAISFVKQVEGDSELLGKPGKAASTIPTFQKWCDVYMSQYSGQDASTIGRLNWWCEFFGNKPVTKIDELMVDDGLMHNPEKDFPDRQLIATSRRCQRLLFILSGILITSVLVSQIQSGKSR